MKQKICCLVVVSLLLVSIIPTLISAESKDVTNKRKIGNVHVDASAVLRDLGYTKENMSNVPSKLMVQILRSYHAKAELHDDGDYYITITPDSLPAKVNLIGSNRTMPYDLDLSQPPDSSGVYNTKSTSGGALDAEGRACLVFAIWDYPGSAVDMPGAEDEFDNISNWISSICAYDYWNFLTNNEATQYYIWAWITWACVEYDSVDIYWNGHGIEVGDESAYVSYDAWDDGEGVIAENLYFADDFSTGEYDYSTLRVGSGSFCYGWGFHDTFLNPGGSVSHNRAYMGSDTEISLAYTIEYIDTWGEVWYDDYEGSAYAHSEADDAADIYLGAGQNPFDYEDNSGSIWFR